MDIEFYNRLYLCMFLFHMPWCRWSISRFNDNDTHAAAIALVFSFLVTRDVYTTK